MFCVRSLLCSIPLDEGSTLTLPYLLCCSPGPGLSCFLLRRNEKRDLSFGARTDTATQMGTLIPTERVAFRVFGLSTDLVIKT